jgi:hypothetical protein
MLEINMDKESVTNVRQVLESLGQDFDKAMKVAISKTIKKVKTQAARKLKGVIPAPASILRRAVTAGRAKPRGGTVSGTVYLQIGHPIPLKYLKPRASKKHGVIVQEFVGTRRRLADGFMRDQWGKSVYRRVGSARTPLKVQSGPEPGQVMRSHGIDRVAFDTAKAELPKQVKERVRFLTLKAQGKLRNN